MKIELKSKIRYNGREYSSPSELPPEARAAYERALGDGAFRAKVVFNGQEFISEDAMPTPIRKLCGDVMSVIEHNGEVTLPNNRRSNPLLTKRQVLFVILFALALAGLILLRLAE